MFAAGKAASGAEPTDAQFNYVTMLLHGNGTNGAQNNTFLDSSTNNFTITRNGNTTQGTFTPYGSNWSNYFTGANSLSFATNAAFSLNSSAFTIEAWVCLDSVSGDRAVTSTYGSGSTGWSLQFNSGILTFYRAGDTIGITATSAISAGVWYHIAVSGTAGTSMKMFINGVQQGSTSTGNITDSSTALSVGQLFNVNYLAGYVSNLRIVKGTALYTSNFTPPTSPLTAVTNTSLLTCQSNRFIDSSANAFTCSLNGSPSVQRFSPFSPTTAYSTSVIGGSGYFDGTDDLRISTNSAFAIGTGDFTFEAWINPPSWASAAPFFVCTGTGGLWIGKNGSNFVVRAYGVADQLQYATVPTTNAWTHIVAVRSGTTLSLFYNGIRVATTTNSYSFAQQPVSIGSDGEPVAPTYYTGYISNLRLVKGTAVYDPTASTLTIPTAPLTAITNTSLLLSYTNAGILDNAMMNDLETVGNAQISTSVKKYGTGSMYFDGTGDYLSTPDNPSYAYGTGNFTIEAWIYPTTVSSYHRIYSQYFNPDNQIFFRIGVGVMNFYVVVSATTLVNISSSASSISANTWTHVAIVRNSNTFTIYINGVANGTTTTSITMPDLSAPVLISTYDGTNESFTGYIDDLRITKGVARYTTTFTPPTAAFPDKG